MDWSNLIKELQPVILSACTIIVTALFTALTRSLSKKAGAETREKNNQVVQTAFYNGALAAAGSNPNASVREIAAEATDHALSSVSGPLKALNPTAKTKNVIATAKATEALAKVANMQAQMRDAKLASSDDPVRSGKIP